METRAARRAIIPIAEAQRGLVTTQQAAHVGVSRLTLSRLEAAGDLDRMAHGVYRVAGSGYDEYTDVYAQWLALDPGRTAAERVADRAHMIAVSHRSAAAIYEIGDLPADVDTFTASYRKQSQREGVRVHTGSLDPADVRVEHGMLVTTPDRTLVDLRRTEPDASHVADALADALEARRLTRESAARALGADTVARMLALKELDSASLAHALVTSATGSQALKALQEAFATDAKLGVEALPKVLQDLPWNTLADAVSVSRVTDTAAHGA